VKLRDRKLHEESNCTLPPAAAPPASSSSNDVACDGMEAYHLSQLDHLLCHDVAANSLWMPNPQADFRCGGHFGPAAPMIPIGRLSQPRGLAKRSRPGLFSDRRDGMQAAAKNNEFSTHRPKVMNARQRGNSTFVHNNDDAGKSCAKVMLYYSNHVDHCT